ncbi:MAG: DUF421 domain-containing protein [Nocardioidaceae bacterium]
MEEVLQGLAIYVVLLLLCRLAGKRSLRDASISDLLLLIVVGETIQQVLAGRDFSFVIAAVAVVALLAVVRLSEYLGARKQPKAGERDTRPTDAGAVPGLVGPVVLVDHGELLEEPMARARVTEADILFEARQSEGVDRLDQIRYAVLHQSGGIGVVATTS